MLDKHISDLHMSIKSLERDLTKATGRQARLDIQSRLRGAQKALVPLLYAAGRSDEIPAGNRVETEGVDFVVHGFPRKEDMPLLGPDTQIWIGRGLDGDKFFSLKPSPAGNGHLLMHLQTRYSDPMVMCGREDVLRSWMQSHRLSRLDMSEESVPPGVNDPDDFLVPVPLPQNQADAERYSLLWVHRVLPQHLQFHGCIQDGFIRWSASTLNLVLDFQAYSMDWFRPFLEDDALAARNVREAGARKSEWQDRFRDAEVSAISRSGV